MSDNVERITPESMEENAVQDAYSEMSYQELKSLASERGLLKGNMKQDAILEALREDDAREPAETPQEPERVSGQDVEAEPERIQPKMATVEYKVPHDVIRETSDVFTAEMRKAKEYLSTEPKIPLFVPLLPGEKDGAVLEVGYNGYNFFIKKGYMVEVPKTIHEIVFNNLQATAQAGKEFLIDRNKNVESALN